MLKIETSTNWARTCDICRASACSVYCRADAAYLCAGCDSEIHSANPLARRHHRVPISHIPEYGPHNFLNHPEASNNVDDDEAASWLLLNPMKKNSQSIDNNSNGLLFGGEVDQYLDLDDYNSSQISQFSSDQYNNNHHYQPQQHYSVSHKGKDLVQQQFFQLGLDDYEASNTDYNYPASLSHNVSFSSMEVGVVPESTMSEGSVSHSRPPKGTIDLFSGSSPIQTPTQLSPVDREARVSRYREKKKMRKFEKTIRYASRKAYAETRPRIKGRFAKRTEGESKPDQTFSTSLNSEGAYGVVPSF